MFEIEMHLQMIVLHLLCDEGGPFNCNLVYYLNLKTIQVGAFMIWFSHFGRLYGDQMLLNSRLLLTGG